MKEPSSRFDVQSDSFLYAVYQAYEARHKRPGEFHSHLRYEPFLTATEGWNTSPPLSLTQLKNILREIFTHHFQVLPHYRRDESVTLENIAWFSHSIATLFADIETLLYGFTGFGIPCFCEKDELPHVASGRNIVVAIEKYNSFLVQNGQNSKQKFELFPLQPDNGKTLDELYTLEIWSLVSSTGKKVFGSYFELIRVYALWRYKAEQNEPELTDWHVRPPCNIAYRKQFKELFDREREERKNTRSEKKEQRKEKQQTPHGQSPEKNHVAPSRPKPTEPLPTQKVPRSSLPPQHEEGLEEVKTALQQLNEYPDLSEINLKPRNSFIRRQQHLLANEAGFLTESRGEDERDRFVCIKRKG